MRPADSGVLCRVAAALKRDYDYLFKLGGCGCLAPRPRHDVAFVSPCVLRGRDVDAAAGAAVTLLLQC